MLRANNIPQKNSFNIWFNREKRKEFYTTSVIMYKTTFNHKYNNSFPNIILKSEQSEQQFSFTSSNFKEPFEENSGTFLIRFINTDFSYF